MTRDHLALARRALNGDERMTLAERPDPLGPHDDRARQRAPQLPPAQPVADDAARRHRAVPGAGRRGPARPRRGDHRQVRRRDRRLRGSRRLSRQGRRVRRRDGCRAPALRARPRQGHRVVPRLGRAGGLVGLPRGVQRHARREAERVRDGPAPPALGRGASEDRRAAASDHRGHQRDVDRHGRRHPHRRAAVRGRAGAADDVRRPRGVREGAGVADVALSGRDPRGRHRGSATA